MMEWFMETPGCWNCLHEESCNWKPAGENDRCESWTPDPELKEKLAYTE